MSGSGLEEPRDGNGAGRETKYNDVSIECIDCGRDFVWSAGAQTFFHDKGLTNIPKRCKQCKRAKNRRLAAVERARLNGQPALIKVAATCARCEKRTTIPFYPSQGRPVYCRSCFEAAQGEVGAAANG